MRRSALACVIAALVCACAAPTRDAERGATSYAYVVLGAEGRPVARVISHEATCPAITLDGVEMPMDVRAPPSTIPLRPTLSPPAQSKPSVFPVLTCEKTIPEGVARAAVLDHALPLPVAHPRRIVVIGDTGCRIKTGDNIFQACNDPALWPFPQVARAAADVHPDLVIHVGDYHYRENPCPAGNAGCAASPWGYGWDTWEADVFAPAAKLFAAAPWIVVRGNHESCNRAGQGWWRFLDPRPLAPRRDCNVAADDSIGDYSDPYAVPLGSGVDADTQFIVFDSSLVGVNPLVPADPMYIRYRAQFEAAFALAARSPNAFFMDHHPILAFAPNPAKPLTPHPGNGALQSVLSGLHPTVLFPPNVQALLSGHVHLFEVVTFATPQPPQFVTGNGGDWIDTPLPVPLPPGTTPAPGAVVAGIVASNRFGFMTIERDGARWRMIAHDVRGSPMTSCTLSERRATCDPIAP
ncbi:MAG TPA: metallophosphoesterase [Casimicrobiaceae bacterium]|nr:metallophosphoesterase [Casimicrobiaceae bacterium]